MLSEIRTAEGNAARAFHARRFGRPIARVPGENVGCRPIEGAGIGAGLALTAGPMRRMGPPPGPCSPVRSGTMSFEAGDCGVHRARAPGNGGAEALPPQARPGIGRCGHAGDGQGTIAEMITPGGDD